jgi:hypothetical protein
MSDILLVAVVIGFFALAALYVRGCELLVGRPDPGRATPASTDDAPDSDTSVVAP